MSHPMKSAGAAFGLSCAASLTFVGSLALIGFGLYLLVGLAYELLFDVLGVDLATFLLQLVMVCAFATVACGLLSLCARLIAWIYGVFGRTRAAVWTAQADTRLANVDAGGVPPLPRQLLENPQFASALLTLVQQGIEARKPPQVPQTFTYAPHLRYSNDVQDALAEPVVPSLDVKDFWSLFTGGHLPEHGFLMGYSLDDGQPILADWRTLYSVLIGGQSGTGKSTLIRSILAQSAIQGGRFLVLDPHFGAGEESLGASLLPLQARMMAEPAANDAQMLDTLRYTAEVGQRRLQGKDGDKTPLVLIVDELTGLLTRSTIAEELTEVLGRISQETRKVGVFCLAIGQQFSSEVISTPVRNSFVSYLSCRTRRDVARVMSGSNTFGKAAETLTTGQAVWMTPAGEFHRIAVPNTTTRHMHLVAQSLASHASEAATAVATALPASLVPIQATVSGVSKADSAAVEAAGSVFDPRVTRVRQLILEKKSAKEIIGEVWGATSGDKYRRASAEYQAIVQQLIR